MEPFNVSEFDIAILSADQVKQKPWFKSTPEYGTDLVV